MDGFVFGGVVCLSLLGLFDAVVSCGSSSRRFWEKEKSKRISLEVQLHSLFRMHFFVSQSSTYL